MLQLEGSVKDIEDIAFKDIEDMKILHLKKLRYSYDHTILVIIEISFFVCFCTCFYILSLGKFHS